MRYCVGLCLLALLLAGCRTYVGSDDLYETSSPVADYRNATQENAAFGMQYRTRDGQCLLTFGTEYDLRYAEHCQKWRTGRCDYYLSHCSGHCQLDLFFDDGTGEISNIAYIPPFNLVLYVFHTTFSVFVDTINLCSGKSWHLHGEHLPGPQYLFLGYMPVVTWINPFLRPPYDFDCLADLEKDTKLWGRTKTPENITTVIYEPGFAPDASGETVEITCNGVTLRKKLAPDGSIAFRWEEFGVRLGRSISQQPLSVRHPASGHSWELSVPMICNDGEIQNWNLAANESLSVRQRLASLAALRKVLGEEQFTELARQILYGQHSVLLACRTLDVSCQECAGGAPKTPVLVPGFKPSP